MSNTRTNILDLSPDELERQIVKKEPSLEDLFGKTMHLLRLSINALSRICVVKAAIGSSDHASQTQMYQRIAQVAKVTQDLEELVFEKNKVPAEAETL